MSQYPGITAEQARDFSSAAPSSPEETLEMIENIVGQAAENQQVTSARATLSKAAHSKQGVEFAALHLITRGFVVNQSENGPYYIVDVTW